MKIQAEKEGMEKGREETRKEIALNLLTNNMNIQEVATITGLSVEEIQSLNS